MNDNTVITAVASVVLPFLIDLVNRYVSQTWLRFAVALVSSLLVGMATTVVRGGWDNVRVFESFATSFVVAQTVYNMYWKDAGVRERIVGDTKVAKK